MSRAIQNNGIKRALAPVAPGGTPTLLLPANAARVSALLRNNGSVTVFLGNDNTVTPASGTPLLAGEAIRDISTSDAWWGVTAGTAGDIRGFEVT